MERLEKDLTESWNSSLARIESDITEFGKKKIQRLANANHKHFKEVLEEESQNWTA